MDQKKRVLIGTAGVVGGLVLFTIGVLWAHFTGLSEENTFGQEIYPNIPRGWFWVLTGQVTAFVGSQIILVGIVIGWLWERPLTWARASVGALLFTLEMLLLFGVVPNEWLTLTQGEFEWTSQKVWLTLPTWATLNNEVTVSYAVIKDSVSGLYSAVVLGIILVSVYQIQERSKKAKSQAKEAPPEVVSTYGRPVVKGEG